MARADPFVPPTHEDGVAAAASEVIGGPQGRFAVIGRAGWRPAAMVLVALSSVLVALGVLEKAHCVDVGWGTPDQFWHACYSDLPVLYGSSGMGAGGFPFLSSGPRLDQPLISGVALWFVGLFVPGGSALHEQQWYFALWAAVIAALVLVLVIVSTASALPAPWRAAHVALSPVLVTAALISVDLVGVLLTALGVWAWLRRRPQLAGVLLGLAVLARSYPVLVIAAIGLVAVGAGRLRQWRTLALTALATVVALALPFLVVDADHLLSAYRAWWSAGAGYGSPWLLPTLRHHPLPAVGVTVLAVLGWVAALVAGAAYVRLPRRRPSEAQVALLMIAIVLVTGKAMPVQACLWVLPFLALVVLRWRDHLIWAGMELVYFIAVWLYIAGLSTPTRALPAGTYGLLLLARLVAWAYLTWQVCRVSHGAPVPSGPGPPLVGAPVPSRPAHRA